MVARRVERDAFVFYEPQPSRYPGERRYAARRRLGLHIFPRSRMLPRTLLPLVEADCNGFFLIDAVNEGQAQFPLWGRAVPRRGNLAFALKLAHRTGARLQPAYFLREGAGRAALHLLEPIEPAPGPDRDAFIEETARRLSGIFEPVIAANLAQWYMLKDMRL